MQRTTGERFNLFKIFGVGHYEVSTHSPLLCDLLDPRGSHGQGATFLKCFIDTLNLNRPFNADDATIRTEVSIGPRKETTGGRLDILIEDKKKRQIAIENKIHAGEQQNWVRRYRNGLRPDAWLIYLTLDGKRPLELDKDRNDDVLCVSYASGIVKWLESCRKEVSTVPIVRESLTQYIHLIQTLTHQNSSSRMNEAIVSSVLDNLANFQAYCALRDANRAIKGRIIRDLGVRIRSHVPDGFELVATPTGNCAVGDGFSFSTPSLKGCNLKAVISFDSDCYRNCFYGFEVIDRAQPITKSSLVCEVLFGHFKGKFSHCNSSGHWPAWKTWAHRPHWDDKVLELIAFGGTQFDEEIAEIAIQLFDVANAFSEELAKRV